MWVFNSAIAALAILGAPLVPYESASSIDESAWRRMAHLLYALHRIKFGLKYEPDQISRFWTEFERVDSPAALDVIVRLHDQYVDSNIGVRAALGEYCRAGIGRLCRVALSRDYVATTHLRDRRFHDELEDDHRAFAFDFLGTYGRHTDLPVIRAWIEDGRYGERAHDAAKRIEGRYGSDSAK